MIELSYWKGYDKVFKHFSSKRIYAEILKIVEKLGEPFEKKSSRDMELDLNYLMKAGFEAGLVFTHYRTDNTRQNMD